MNKNKNARQVNYYIKRENKNGKLIYWLYTTAGKLNLIERKQGGWHADGTYHQTMRDAIIYCLYGV